MTAARVRLFADELTVGASFPFEPYEVTEREILDFAGRWDPQWFHLEPVAARSGPFQGLIASGIQTLAIAQRLSVLAAYGHWQVIAGRELHSLRFRRPVRPGMTLTGAVEITAITPDRPAPGRADRSLVSVAIDLIDSGATDPRGSTVLSGAMDMFVARRSTAS
ncbi:MaoC/PaaZ C-terminal domain-containing protein [Millisia brevis]|uniref:MaoC/PaaZ C-terminal domain-containing protein n=1 Tax=Millisia brevis TaxID=264148 RepID=UPI00083696EF|nr:MaoC/PaaZ C-terminal domain-containing protein [Millisia brevis]